MPLPALIGALAPGLIPAIGSAFDSWFGSKTQKENVDKTIAANKELAQYAYARDLEMWNRGNVYNAPFAQMERLRAAGLNPNMVYGSGTVAGQAAGQLPKYNAPTVDYSYTPPVQLGNVISQFQDFQVKNAQIDNLKAQAEDRIAMNKILGGEDQAFPGQSYRYRKMVEALEGAHWKAKNLNYDRQIKEKLFTGGLYESQAAMARNKVRTSELANQKMTSEIKNLNLRNEYFAAQAIMQMFGGLGKAFGVLKPGARGGSALKQGSTRALQKDAAKWRQFERAYKRNR